MAIKRLIAIIMVAFLLIAGALPAYADDGIDKIIPETNIDGSTTADADEYSMSDYHFDAEKFGVLDVLPAAMKMFADILFFINVMFSKLVNFLLVQAFQLDIFSYIEVVFDDLIRSLGSVLYRPMLGILVPIAGITMMFYLVVSKMTKAISLGLQTLMIIIIAAIFLAVPSKVISTVNDVSTELGRGSLAATAAIVNGRAVSQGDAVLSLSNVYWGNAVVNPWQLIQYGELSPTKAEDYLSANHEERQTLAAAETNVLFKKNGQYLRFVLAFFFLLLNLIMSVLVLILASIMILSQFGAIIASITAILGFAIALLPNMGLRVAIHAIYNVFTFLLTRIGIMLLMCVYFAVSAVLYRNINTAGWFFTLILQVLLIAAIILYREKIFSFVKSATRGSQAAIKNIEDRPNIKRMALEGYAAAKIGGDVKRVWDNRVQRGLERKYEPVAEQYLYKRYDEEKARAERQAQASGEAPQYSDFVRKTDARVERGITPFSLDDLKSTTEMMVKVHRQGEDPDRLVMTSVSGKSDNQIRKDQRGLEARIKATRTDLKTKEDANERTIDRVIRTDPMSQFFDPGKMVYEMARGEAGTRGESPRESERTYYQAQPEEREAEVARTEAAAQVHQQTADGTLPTDPLIQTPGSNQSSGGGNTAAVNMQQASMPAQESLARSSQEVEAGGVSVSQSEGSQSSVATTVQNVERSNQESSRVQAHVVQNVTETNSIHKDESRVETEVKAINNVTQENITTRQENVQNITQTQQIESTAETKNVENRQETTHKTEHAVTNNVVNEKKDFITSEITTQNQTKNVTVTNVQTHVIEQNEVTNESVHNNSHTKEQRPREKGADEVLSVAKNRPTTRGTGRN